MSSSHDTAPARSAVPVVLATADADGVVESLATSLDPVTLSGAALDGALMADGAITGTAPRNITVTLSATVGAFDVGSTFSVTGRDAFSGAQVTDVLAVTDADGDETLVGSKMFAPGYPLTIDIEAQADDDGTFTIGAGTSFTVPGCRWIYAAGAGDIVGVLAEDSAPITIAVTAGQDRPYGFRTFHAGTTATGILAIVK